MSDTTPQPAPTNAAPPIPGGSLFAAPPTREGGLSTVTWVVAGLVVIAVIASVLFATRRHATPPANTPLPLAAYAPDLPISGESMSESTSLSGGKSTFIDGHIRNTGSKTVTGATVQVFFRNDEGMPPSMQVLPLPLVRTREPYVDTQPVSAAPIKPGEDREFRLIFETIPGNWNVQLPDIHVVGVTTE